MCQPKLALWEENKVVSGALAGDSVVSLNRIIYF